MQQLFVFLFEAILADIVRADIVAGILHLRDFFRVAPADATDITGYVRCGFAERILAEQARLDFHAGKAETLYRKTCDFFIGQTSANRHAFEILCFIKQAPKTLAVLWLDIDQ